MQAKSKMAFRVDFDYLRGLLHLLDEVQNLNLMPVPLHSRVIPTTDMPHSSSSSPGILHKESTKPGIGILNLSGIPLCVRLSQFFFKNPSTAHMKGEPDFSASQNVASAQHTTEWCPIPAIEYGLLVVSGQDDVVIVPGASRCVKALAVCTNWNCADTWGFVASRVCLPWGYAGTVRHMVACWILSLSYSLRRAHCYQQ